MTSPQQPGAGDPEERAHDQPEHDSAANSSPATGQDSSSEVTGQASSGDGGADQSVPSAQPEGPEEEAGPAEQAEQAEQEEAQQEGTEQAEQAEQAEQEEAQQEGTEQAETEPPKKKRTGLVAAVAAAVVVVLVGGGAGVFFAFFAGDSAKEVAEKYVAVATKETQNPRSVTAADYRPIVCKKSMPQVEQMQKRKTQILKSINPAALEKVKKVKTSLKKVDTNGDRGTATFETAFPGQPPQKAELKLIKEEGAWQLCG